MARSGQVDMLEGFARMGLAQSQYQSAHYRAPSNSSAPAWFVDPNQVSVDDEQPLGGAAGSQMTFRGHWIGTVVAVRKLPPETAQQTLLDYLRRLRALDCVNVLPVLGASSEAADPPYFLAPYLYNGSVVQYLESYPGASRPKIIAEASLGMEYLHSVNIEHGRFKTSNVLVNEQGQACISDAGLYSFRGMPESPCRYFSPEAWRGTISKPSDVFAFAVVTYEILSSVLPWGFLSDTQVFKLVVSMGERPERQPSSGPALPISDREWQLCEDGWHADPDARPTLKQIVARLGARNLAESREGPSRAISPSVASTQAVSQRFHIMNADPAPSRSTTTRPPSTSGVPPAPPAYVPSDGITTFRPSPSSRTSEKAVIDSSGVLRTSPLAITPPARHDAYVPPAASQSNDGSRPFHTGPYGSEYSQSVGRSPSSASGSSSGYPGGFRGTMPSDSIRTPPSIDRYSVATDYLTRPYSSYEVPGVVSNYSGYDIPRAPTGLSTSSGYSGYGHSRAPPLVTHSHSVSSTAGMPPRNRYGSQSSHSGSGSGGMHSGGLPSSANSQFGFMSGVDTPPTSANSTATDVQSHAQGYIHSTSTKRFSQVDSGWQTVFDSNYHRIPVYPETWFKKDWELAEVHAGHCLFRRRTTDKHFVNVYTVQDKKLRTLDLKSEPDTVGLSQDGRYLATSLGSSINLIEVRSNKVLKRARNNGVRQWTSNYREFCWVDPDGVFWKWPFSGGDEPSQVFRLKSTAPTNWMRPMTTNDGDWYAICSTDRDRRSGVVHCYPADNGPARVFGGVSAGFIEVDGEDGLKTPALATLKTVLHAGNHFFEIQIHHLCRQGGSMEPKRYNNEHAGKSLSRMWDDWEHSMVVAAVATRSNGYAAYVFDSTNGDLLCTHPINDNLEERVYCGAGGLFLEKDGRTIKKLQLHPGGLILDTSPSVSTGVQQSTSTKTPDAQPLSSPSMATLSQTFSTSLGRTHTSGSDDSGSKKKSGGWRAKLRSMTAAALHSDTRPDRITSGHRSTSAPHDGYASFGQGIGEDESWIYQKR